MCMVQMPLQKPCLAQRYGIEWRCLRPQHCQTRRQLCRTVRARLSLLLILAGLFLGNWNCGRAHAGETAISTAHDVVSFSQLGAQ